VHFQAFQDGANLRPFLRKGKCVIVRGVGFGVEIELEAELVNELCMNSSLVKNRHHERPSIEVEDEVAEKTE